MVMKDTGLIEKKDNSVWLHVKYKKPSYNLTKRTLMHLRMGQKSGLEVQSIPSFHEDNLSNHTYEPCCDSVAV
jgi:hypothetical protein